MRFGWQSNGREIPFPDFGGVFSLSPARFCRLHVPNVGGVGSLLSAHRVF
jgi:hypothetical protein